MSDTAAVIAVAYSIAVVIGGVVCFAVWRSTLRHDTGVADEEAYSRREGVWLVIVLGSLFVLLLVTIFSIPYAETAGPGRQVVRVDAHQFAWSIAPNEVRVGVPVEFRMRASDVNHGFGLYSPDDVLLKQAQIMPGEVQKLVYTFDEPGTYEVLCLEFCGAGHHLMDGRTGGLIEVRG